MSKHANLSIFVPHAGCPHMCSFCDQRAISGTQKAPTAEEVSQLCDKYLPKTGDEKGMQIAFFGGSFTAIEPHYRKELLAAAYPFVQNKRAEGIRLSTRPDAIDEDILRQLSDYGVVAIELGAQSMDNKILAMNDRGHTAQDVIKASDMIKKAGFELGVQMMPGLYGEEDYRQGALYTSKELLKLNPDTVRIYPAITIKNTKLGELYEQGKYIPLTLSEAVDITADLIGMYEKNNVRIIRVGLAADASLEKNILAGPYHPAFMQLCCAKIYYKSLASKMAELDKGSYIVTVPRGERSTAAGQKNANIIALAKDNYYITIQESDVLSNRDFTIKKV
ncbi:MAG: radical SAM protein [Oscillospiraceae bacterium]